MGDMTRLDTVRGNLAVFTDSTNRMQDLETKISELKKCYSEYYRIRESMFTKLDKTFNSLFENRDQIKDKISWLSLLEPLSSTLGKLNSYTKLLYFLKHEGENITGFFVIEDKWVGTKIIFIKDIFFVENEEEEGDFDYFAYTDPKEKLVRMTINSVKRVGKTKEEAIEKFREYKISLLEKQIKSLDF